MYKRQLGTQQCLFETAQFVSDQQKLCGGPIGSPELVAQQQGFIDQNRFARLAIELRKTDYGVSLMEQVRRQNFEHSAVG